MKTMTLWTWKGLLTTLTFPVVLLALGCLGDDHESEEDSFRRELYWEADDSRVSSTGQAEDTGGCEVEPDRDETDGICGPFEEDLWNQSAEPDTALPKEELQHLHRSLDAASAAIESLKREDDEEAASNVGAAVEHLEGILERNPDTGCVVVQRTSKPQIRVADASEAERVRAEAEALRDQGDSERSRVALDELVNEVRETVVLAHVPSLLAELREVRDGMGAVSPLGSQCALVEALDRFRTPSRRFPLPLIEAQKRLEAARDLVDDDEHQARLFIEDASSRVRLSELLGHGREDTSFEFSELRSALTELAVRLDGEDALEEVDRLIQQLSELVAQVIDHMNDEGRVTGAG